jgi:hypothetical protein
MYAFARICKALRNWLPALLVARLADGRTATLTYSQSAALLTVEELSAGVYIHFDAIADER